MNRSFFTFLLSAIFLFMQIALIAKTFHDPNIPLEGEDVFTEDGSKDEEGSDTGRGGFAFTIKAGYDMFGKLKTDIDDYEVENSISASAELSLYWGRFFALGAGAAWQKSRPLSDYKGEFSFLPIYGLLKIHFAGGEISPYIIGHLGANYIFCDEDFGGPGTAEGKIYYALGAGMLIHNVQVELLYSINTADLDQEITQWDEDAFPIEYSKITLSIGYMFN